jgi:chemotaxis protein CheD
VSKGPDDVIKTFALATCVGLVYYSMRKHALAMAHIQLPVCRVMSVSDKPSRFADRCAEFLLKEMAFRHGVTGRELQISVYGGVSSGGGGDMFMIGEKNLDELRRSLKRLGLVYKEVDTGGNESRTLVAHASTGIVEVLKRPMAFRSGIAEGKGAPPIRQRAGPQGPAARQGTGRPPGFLR